MKRDDSSASSSEVPHTTPASSAILLSLADTTWRMFVPTIGLLMAGRALDNKFGTKPWLMLAGVIVGSVIAWALVRKQLRDIQKGSV